MLGNCILLHILSIIIFPVKWVCIVLMTSRNYSIKWMIVSEKLVFHHSLKSVVALFEIILTNYYSYSKWKTAPPIVWIPNNAKKDVQLHMKHSYSAQNLMLKHLYNIYHINFDILKEYYFNVSIFYHVSRERTIKRIDDSSTVSTNLNTIDYFELAVQFLGLYNFCTKVTTWYITVAHHTSYAHKGFP